MKAGKNQQIIERYIDAVNDNDGDRILSFFAEDTVFDNIPGQVLVGQQAIWKAMEQYHQQAQQVKWEVDCLEEKSSGRVHTQGSVRYLLDDNWVHFEVNGVFEIKGSKIVHWH